jgi:WD40 repeat protein
VATLDSHQGTIYGAWFLPDGKGIVTISGDRTARLWNRRGRLLQVLPGHRDAIIQGALSPAGDRLVTCGKDGMVRLWHLEIPALLRRAAALVDPGAHEWDLAPYRELLGGLYR